MHINIGINLVHFWSTAIFFECEYYFVLFVWEILDVFICLARFIAMRVAVKWSSVMKNVSAFEDMREVKLE